MASSSVSQDDIDNDFELNSRRTRIRTARARQINPTLAAKETLLGPMGGGAGRLEAAPVGDGATHELEAPPGGDTSPKAPAGAAGKDKRAVKCHPHLKGKPTRDRRKLREKRRSTGVVHLASTESAGGSTTADDDEGAEAGGGGVMGVCGEAKRAELSAPNCGAVKPRRPSHVDDDDDTESARDSSPVRKGGPVSGGMRAWPNSRNKSPSDLEADDENDHDSLNPSSASNSGLNLESMLPPGTKGHSPNGSNAHPASLGHARTHSNTPVYRPNTPAGPCSDNPSDKIERVVEENRRLLSLMEEKDRKIHLLEYQIQELMKKS
eukprot:maker-scaffold124_size330879-snap-gene-1.32 protein:Tk01488 transcript:maker-scaffold124_size330879-snap-gene-1.32-mRNA-1 annotation:"---NA---"